VYRKINSGTPKGFKTIPSIHGRPFKPNNPSKKGHEKLFQSTVYVPEMDNGDMKINYIFEKKKVKAWR